MGEEREKGKEKERRQEKKGKKLESTHSLMGYNSSIIKIRKNYESSEVVYLTVSLSPEENWKKQAMILESWIIF